MLTAMLHFLHRRYHRPCQVISADASNSALLEGNPDVDRFWFVGRHLPILLRFEWPQIARALRESHPGPIYVCEHHYRQLPRMRRLLALSGVDPARCVFIGEEPGTVHHSVDRLTHFAKQTPAALRASDYPLPTSNSAWAPRLSVFDSDRLELAEWLRAKGWAGRQLILVQPGNHRSMSRKRRRWERRKTDDKAWPLERWAALLRKVHERMPEALIVLRGSDKETAMLERIRVAAVCDAVVVVGTDLRRLFALCEAAHSMISVDTGPAHAAAALGLPLVVMYGAQEQRCWLPRSLSGSPVIGVGGPPHSVRVDQIPVEAVFDAWCKLLSLTEALPRRAQASSAHNADVVGSRSMRLLFAESSKRGYGTEQHIAALATAMARRGHDVRCLASASSPVESLLRGAGVPTISVRSGRTRALRMAVSLLFMTWRHRPDWLISNDPRFYQIFMGLRRFSGARTALFRHWHDAPRKRYSRELLARQADRFILVSEFQREDYRRQGMGVERASILYNPIDTERFKRSPESRARTRSRLGIQESETVVGYVGRIVGEKGVFTLFEASERFLAEAPDARMLWVGDGEGMTELRSRIQASAHRAQHTSCSWEPDMSAIYPAFDVLVVPSLYPDPFGRVSVEAQAAGVPVVCSSSGGLPETLLPGVTGFLVPATDSVALANTVLGLIRDRALRQDMGEAGSSWVRSRFGFDTIARAFETLLEG